MIANKIYDILLELAGAQELNRAEFVNWFEEGCFGREYRFGGKFIGAKFWASDNGHGNCYQESWHISCYQERETEESIEEISIINTKLRELWQLETSSSYNNLI